MSYNQTLSEPTARQSRRFLLGWDIGLPIVLLIIGTVLFRITDWDMALLRNWYHPVRGWLGKSSPLFNLLYHYGNIPALLVAISGLVLTGMSFQKVKWFKWRKIGAFLVLSMLLGPGLLINTILKDNWGRPRPRNLMEFGGKYQYEAVLSRDSQSSGQSFPCGHASMGFYLFVPWFVLRKNHRRLAIGSLGAGLVCGTAIGIARMAQGAHFASDVLWAAGLVYLTAAAVFHLLNMQRSIWFYSPREDINPAQRAIITLFVGFFVLLLIIGVALATPYSKERQYVSEHVSRDSLKVWVIDIVSGQAELVARQSDSLIVTTSVEGFGFPRSRLRTGFSQHYERNMGMVKLSQLIKGFFTELTNELTLVYPSCDSLDVHIAVMKGSVRFTLPDSCRAYALNISITQGSLELVLPENSACGIQIAGNAQIEDKRHILPTCMKANPSQRVWLFVQQGQIILR